MSSGLPMFAGGLAVVLFIVFVWVVLRRRSRTLPGRVGEFRCEFEGARVVADNIVRRAWVVPVVFTNTRRSPARAPQMYSIATVQTSRRTPVLRRPYLHNATFVWDEDVPQGKFNPETTIAARVNVELPVDEFPQKITIATFVNGARGPIYTGRVAALETSSRLTDAS